MKGSTITAMVLAAAAASAATIVALKKAHDKKHMAFDLEDECGYAPEMDESDEVEVDGEDTACADDVAEEAPEETDAADCCKDGVCSFDYEEDDAADQPARVHVEDDTDAKA